MNEAEPHREARDRRALTRLGLTAFVVLFGYMAVWGFGWLHQEQCTPSALSIIGLTAFAIPALYGAFVATVALYSLCKGHAQEATTYLSSQGAAAKKIILWLYSCAPTLTVLAAVVSVGNLYSMFFRYHDYSRSNGFYVYDRLLHHGTYFENVVCPPDDSEQR